MRASRVTWLAALVAALPAGAAHASANCYTATGPTISLGAPTDATAVSPPLKITLPDFANDATLTAKLASGVEVRGPDGAKVAANVTAVPGVITIDGISDPGWYSISLAVQGLTTGVPRGVRAVSSPLALWSDDHSFHALPGMFYADVRLGPGDARLRDMLYWGHEIDVDFSEPVDFTAVPASQNPAPIVRFFSSDGGDLGCTPNPSPQPDWRLSYYCPSTVSDVAAVEITTDGRTASGGHVVFPAVGDKWQIIGWQHEVGWSGDLWYWQPGIRGDGHHNAASPPVWSQDECTYGYEPGCSSVRGDGAAGLVLVVLLLAWPRRRRAG